MDFYIIDIEISEKYRIFDNNENKHNILERYAEIISLYKCDI